MYGVAWCSAFVFVVVMCALAGSCEGVRVCVCVMSLFLVIEVLCVTLYVEVGTVATLCWVLLVCVKWVWKLVGKFRLKQEHYYFGHVSLKMWNHNIREHTTASAWVFLSTSPSHLSHLWSVYAMYPHQHTQTLYTLTSAQVSQWMRPLPAPPVSWRCYCCHCPACPCAQWGSGEAAGQAMSILGVVRMCWSRWSSARAWKDVQKFSNENWKNDYG